MNFIKRLSLAVLSVITLVCLCSCMDMEVGIIVNPDGTVRVYEDVTIDESVLTSLEMTREDLFEEINSDEETADWTSEVLEKSIDGTTYVGQRKYRDLTLENLSELDQSSLNDAGNVSYDARTYTEGFKKYISVDVHIKTEAADTDDSSEDMGISDYIANKMMNLKFRVQSPLEIVETNGTVENNSVYWNLTNLFVGEGSEKTLSVTYLFADFTAIAIGCIVLLIVIIAVAVIIVLAKKKKAIPDFTPSEPKEEVTFDNFDAVNKEENTDD